MNEYQIQPTNEHKYFFILPNLIDDLNLSPFAFRLYSHIKRVAGEEGQCWQSETTLAEKCHMSKGMVGKAKRELQQAGLIRIETRKSAGGGKNYHLITLVDRWAENMRKYESF